jgi:hypothetical protein
MNFEYIQIFTGFAVYIAMNVFSFPSIYSFLGKRLGIPLDKVVRKRMYFGSISISVITFVPFGIFVSKSLKGILPEWLEMAVDIMLSPIISATAVLLVAATLKKSPPPDWSRK